MWRLLLRRCHPDQGGTDQLFVWVQSLREHVAGDHMEEMPREARRQPPRHHPPTTERVPFESAFERFPDHPSLIRYAVDLASTLEPPFSHLLLLLSDLYPAAPGDTALEQAERVGCSYKQLAYIGHLANLSDTQRMARYRLAEEVPLSQRHAGHILQSYGEPTIVKPTESEAEPVAVHDEGGGG